MQASIGNCEKGSGNRLNRRLRPGFALALSLPMVMPAACLANGGQGFVAGGMPFAGVTPVHSVITHTSFAASVPLTNNAHNGLGSTNLSHTHTSTQLSPLVYQLFNPSALSLARTSALAQTQIVHNLVSYAVPTKQNTPALTTNFSGSAFDLDLGSKSDTVTASQIPGFGSAIVNIKVGSQNLSVNQSTQLTQAEAAAVYQVLSTGKQTLTINGSGAASGGSLTIAPAYSQSLDGLSIPKGVSVIDENAGNTTLLLNNGLINSGNFYVLSANGSSVPVAISAPTIDNNRGALISVTLPSSLTVSNGYGSGMSLGLTANTINNSGSIYAPNNVTLIATTIQNDGSITAKSGNLVVQNNGDNLNVAGVGSLNAGRAVTLNVASSNNNASPNLTLTGNSIYSKTVSFNDLNGALDVNAGNITGGVNATAASVAINTAGNLDMLSLNASGDPTLTSMGNLILTSASINTHNEQFTALAGGNITTSDSAKDTIDTSSTTGPGYDITIGAGVTYLVNGNGTADITGKSTTGGSIVLPGISLNTNSADIVLVANQGTVAKTGTISISNVTASGYGSSMFHDGGNITVTADGNITTAKVTTTGLAATGGDGGNITIMSNKGSVTTGDISVNGGSGVAGGKSVAGAGGDGGDGGDGYAGGALAAGATIGGSGGDGGAAGINYGGAGGAGASKIGDTPGTGLPSQNNGKSTILGGTGGNGGQALPNGFAGLDGKAGLDGADGTDANGNGKGGGDAGIVTITAHTSISTGKITAVGGSGGGGGAGGDGGNGGNGGGGGYGGAGQGATGASGFAGGNGGDGGTGGGGGDGSDGGDGGNGGIVMLHAGTSIASKGIDVTGGAGGSGGKGGKGGNGGYGGDGADGGTGGTGSPDSLAYVLAYNLAGTPGSAIYVANYNATSNSGDGGVGGAGGSGGAAGDGGDGGSGGKGGMGGDAGSIVINAGTTVSITSIARAGGAGGNGGVAGQGGQYGKGGDGGDGGSGGYTSFVVVPPGNPPNSPGTYMGLTVLNPDNPEGGLPFNPNNYVQGAGGAGGAGGDGGKSAMSGDGGSGGDANIGGLSGNLSITCAKPATIGSQIFFNGPSGVAGLGASFGMAANPNANTGTTVPTPPVFTQTGKAGQGGMGVITGPFIPLAPNPNPGTNALGASGKASAAGKDGDSGADGSTPTPRGGSGSTFLDYAGVAQGSFPFVSINPRPKQPPFVAPWSTGISWQGNAVPLVVVGLVHANASERNEVEEAAKSGVHSNFARALVEVSSTSATSRALSNTASSNTLVNTTSTVGSITVDEISLTQSSAATSIVSNQTIAGVTDNNANALPRTALLPQLSPTFQLGATVQNETQASAQSCQLYRASENQTIDFGHAKVFLQKNAVALIARKGDAISVYNLGSGRKGEISLVIDGYGHNLGTGQQMCVSSTGINEFAAVNVQPDIAWRSPRLQILPGGRRVFAADFSIVSALQKLQRGNVDGAQALDAGLTAKMLKNAAILASLTGADYVQVPYQD